MEIKHIKKGNEIMEEIRRKLKMMLSPKRYKHTMDVVELAKELGIRYSINLNKVELAALLHDCSKQFTLQKMKELVRQEVALENYSHLGELVHGFSGAIYARNVFGIEDSDVLNAIRFHTIGRRGMSELEKITYIADAIEPSRNFAEVDKIRKLAFVDLDEAVLMEADRKIEYLIRREVVIHPYTVDMRNHILEKLKKRRVGQ